VADAEAGVQVQDPAGQTDGDVELAGEVVQQRDRDVDDERERVEQQRLLDFGCRFRMAPAGGEELCVPLPGGGIGGPPRDGLAEALFRTTPVPIVEQPRERK